MWRVLIGVLLGLPLGWLASEIRRGWRAGQAVDGPPFAPELADAPRQPGEWL